MMRHLAGGRRHWLLTLVAVVIVGLVLINNVLLHANRDAQGELAQRQQEINQGAVFGRLGDQLFRALAAQAANTNDTQIRDLLASQGITFSVQQNPQTPTTDETAGSPAPAISGGK